MSERPTTPSRCPRCTGRLSPGSDPDVYRLLHCMACSFEWDPELEMRIERAATEALNPQPRGRKVRRWWE